MPTPLPANDPAEGSAALERPSRRRRRRLSSGGAGAATGAERQVLAAGLLAAAVVGSVLAIGAVHLPVLLVVAALSFGAAAVALQRGALGRGGVALPLPAVVFAGLAAYTLIQAVPLPVRVLETLAPTAADTWERCLLPFGEAGPRWASLSLDPGGSMVEALKWATYAAVFVAAAAVATRHGAVWGVTTVFGAALATAITTMVHGLAEASAVYGLYTPSFHPSPWHVSPLLNPNNLAGYLNLGALSGLGLMLGERRLLPRWLLGIGVALIVGIGVTSASRAGVITLALGVVLLALFTRHQRRGLGGGSPHRDVGHAATRNASAWMIVVVVACGAVFAFLGGTSRTWAELYSKDLSKLDMMLWVRPLVRDHPIFGIGRGAFESVFPLYRATPGYSVYTHAENFIAQWVAEWGSPVALAALGTLAWAFGPRRLGVGRSAIAAGAWCGVAALLVQNLVDLALEVPAVCIAAAAVLGSIWGDERRARSRQGLLAPPARGWLVAVAVATAGAALEMGVIAFGRHGITADRQAVHDAFEASRSRATLGPLRDLLHKAMLRHPAEAYFPLVGATMAFRTRSESPIPWIQRSLERARPNGRAHLLLAEVLAARGTRGQALLELRFAAEDDPDVCHSAAELAIRWTPHFDELLTTVPEGKSGSRMLTELCNVLWTVSPKRTGAAEGLAERCDREALRRDPRLIDPHSREAQARIEALGSGATSELCPDRAACHEQILEHADAIAAVDPDSMLPGLLRARLLVAEGEPEAGARLLGKTCERPVDRVTCLRELVAIAAKVKAPGLLDAASRDLLGASCSTPAACASTATFLAGVRGGRGETGVALGLLGRAAREDPNNDERWLRLADVASGAGAHAQAIEALEKVARRRGGDPALKQRIAAERDQLLGGYLSQPK